MMKLFVLGNAERFLRLVDQSRGQVWLELPGHILCDLKRDETARQFLRTMTPGPEGLSLRLSEAEDMAAFVRYMTESALHDLGRCS